MKFISLAILSALASFTVAAPAPTPGQCVPQQGQSNDYDYDMVGWYAFDGCSMSSLQFVSGVLKTRGAYNFIDNGSSYHYCSKYHSHIAGGKAVDSEGNRYNVMQVNSGNYDSTYDYITSTSDTVNKYTSKYKFVGQGRLSNSIVTFSYNCHYTYDPINGFHQECKKSDFSFKCSA